jgi:hypothetical protein
MWSDGSESSVSSDKQNIVNDDSDSDWEEIIDDSDSQPQANFQYQELHVPMNSPLATKAPVTCVFHHIITKYNSLLPKQTNIAIP